MHSISLFISCILSFSSPAPKDTSNLETKTVQKTKHTIEEYQVNTGTDVKNGFYKATYEGQILTKGSYSSGMKSGIWEFFFSQDTLQASGNYVEGEKNGIWTCYYRNGVISSKSNYIAGERSDEYIKNYPDGTMKEESKPGLIKYYYENGKVAEEIHMKDGKQNGPAKRYYNTGELKESRFMKNGERDSTYLFYYEDGTLWEHIIYKQGGVWNVLAYNAADGKPLNCCTIKDGNGTMRFYDGDGKITEESEYKNAQRNGSFKRFGKSGILAEGYYLDNQETGGWKFYNNKGLISSKEKKKGRKYIITPPVKLNL